MKKQLLIAAVAATMTSAAIADISISGDAKFEYFNKDDAGTKTNYTNTEVNLGVKGKSGDTTVVANLEFDTHGDASTAIDVEDLYMTTKVGDVSIKAGNYTTSTSALLGEIDEGGRATDKVTLSTKVGGVKVYAGNSGSTGATGVINNNMFAGIVADVAGMKVQLKKNSETVSSMGIAGSMSNVDFRLEQKNSDTANSDVTFGNVTTSINGIDLGYAWIDADAAGLVGETDSAIFAAEMGTHTTGTAQNQITAKTSLAGNAVTVKSGTIDDGIQAGTDLDYVQISASRALASGAKATVTYTDKDKSASTSTETLEIDLSVKF